jgi:hypothetical protein
MELQRSLAAVYPPLSLSLSLSLSLFLFLQGRLINLLFLLPLYYCFPKSKGSRLIQRPPPFRDKFALSVHARGGCGGVSHRYWQQQQPKMPIDG